MQVHEPYLIGPGAYSFGVALQVCAGGISWNALLQAAARLRAQQLRKQ